MPACHFESGEGPRDDVAGQLVVCLMAYIFQ